MNTGLMLFQAGILREKADARCTEVGLLLASGFGHRDNVEPLIRAAGGLLEREARIYDELFDAGFWDEVPQ